MFKKIKEAVSSLFLVLPGALAAVLCVIAVGCIYSLTETRSHLVWLIGLLIYLVFLVLYHKLFRYMRGAGTVAENNSFLSTMTLDLMVKMNMPVMICNGTENIIWHNAALLSASENETSSACALKPLPDVRSNN